MRAKKHNKSISGGSPAPNYQLLLMSILIVMKQATPPGHQKCKKNFQIEEDMI